MSSERGGRGTSITSSFGIKTFDGVVKSPPSTDGSVSEPFPIEALEGGISRCYAVLQIGFRGLNSSFKPDK